MLTLLFRSVALGCIALLITACTQIPQLVENTTIAYFDERGNNISKPSPRGSYRQLLKIQSNGYLVQSFFVNTNTKQTDPFIIHNKEDLTAIDPLSIDGFFVQWHRNGQKAGSGHFINGKRQGTFTEWTEQGTKWAEMQFENDLANGKANLWYEDGSKYIEGQYLAGKEEGEWRIWQQNGPIRFKATFVQGSIISAVDANGKPINLSKDDFTTK
ncbi:toxin-antitoxin system YwqK family antitoxin [Entomomonas asaccharolytica]|uniref:Toxin-antitoxin system YwqK family antitoxin n=1 Tax=Entomomonas asaccharolytica TaxID=2785331 RepID=A0A974RXD4_9GAMM|nr:hypothetical protein [Entomomonas asaccharolytica]QQP84724.1 hypothetical protein JHT90_09925 [Entomomonas asaccharolytica]